MFQGTSSKSGKKSTADEAILVIDLQIANLRESIRILNGQRNGHLPISKLPVEILTKIFLLHQKNATLGHAFQRLVWTGISHVSQQWRETAVNFSRLWIHIPFDYPKWAKEMIERSQRACPIVRATYDPSVDLSQAKLLRSFLQQHLSRVQVLDIRNTSPQLVAKLFQDIQPTSVPCLSTLSLSIPWRKPGTESTASFDPLQIVSTRLLDTNSLRKVEAPTTLRWDLKLFSGLTHLSLGHPGDHDNDMPRTQTSHCEFLDALRRMSTLRCLNLQGLVLPEAVNGSSLEPVCLQNLQDLVVCDTVSTVGFFLRHVNFPAATRTTFGCEHIHPDLQLATFSPVFVPLERLLLERPRALKLHHIKVVRFDDWDIFGLKFEGWISSDCPSSLEGYDSKFPSSNPDFTIIMEWDSLADIQYTPNILDSLCAGLLGIFSPDDVVSLSISSNYKNDKTVFMLSARKIGQFPALDALFLSNIFSTPFLLELNCDVSYPALRYLDFTTLQIDGSALAILPMWLKTRSERGLGPRKLRMDLRGLGTVNKKATTIALLEEVVEVVWVMEDPDSGESAGSDSDSDVLVY
jgi:hypothetical protein